MELTFVNGNQRVLPFVYRNYFIGNKYVKPNQQDQNILYDVYVRQILPKFVYF